MAQMTSTEFAAWVAKQSDQAKALLLKANVAGVTLHPLVQADTILADVRDQALRQLTHPPKSLLGMVQFQRELNGRTWPRAWALAIYLQLAPRYYRRKARR